MEIDVKMDDSLVRELEKELEWMSTQTVEVGYFQDQTHQESGLPLPTLAMYMNNGVKAKDGSTRIPAREFMDMSFYFIGDEIPKYNAIMQDSLIFGGKKQLELGLKMVGDMAVETIPEAIETQDFAPLKPATIRAKNSDVILVETGQLYSDAEARITTEGGK